MGAAGAPRVHSDDEVSRLDKQKAEIVSEPQRTIGSASLYSMRVVFFIQREANTWFSFSQY